MYKRQRQGQPHRSPSLSWTGRYLAFIRQRGTRPEAVLLDRLSGRLQPLALPNDRLPERLSLAPDGQQLAVQVLRRGQLDLELFRLPALEPDLPAGAALP